MNCADQYYGGEMFKGATDVTQAICMHGGVLGYCGGDFFSSYDPNGNDIFDAIAGAPGTYLTEDIRGNVSFGFDDQLWSQRVGDIANQPAGSPLTAFAVYKDWTPFQVAESHSVAENMTQFNQVFVPVPLLSWTVWIPGGWIVTSGH